MSDTNADFLSWLDEDRWIDVSRPLHPAIPVWPGDRQFELHQTRTEGLVLSSFTTTCHVGTHVDAPFHLDTEAPWVDAIPLRRLVGEAEVVRVAAGSELASPATLPNGWRPTAARVLFRSDSHAVDAPIGPAFTALAPELVDWLADRGVELVGVDTPSVDPFDAHDLAAHGALLRRGMTWIEGLSLHDVEPGRYLMVALPIRLAGAEAAPLRALLRPLG